MSKMLKRGVFGRHEAISRYNEIIERLNEDIENAYDGVFYDGYIISENIKETIDFINKLISEMNDKRS